MTASGDGDRDARAERDDAERELPLPVTALVVAPDPPLFGLPTGARVDRAHDPLGERVDDLLLVRQSELTARLEERLDLLTLDAFVAVAHAE